MRKHYLPITLCLALFLSLFSGCMVDQDTRVLGTIDFVGSASVYLDLPTVHYKYVEPRRISVPLNGDHPARFDHTVAIDTAQIVWFYIGDQSYPLYLIPGNSLEIEIKRNSFPNNVQVDGYNRDWNSSVKHYLTAVDTLEDKMTSVKERFLAGKSDELISLYQSKMQLARKHLANTPFRPLYLATIGEYLVKRLEYIRYAEVASEQRESQRQAIIQEAKSLDFFTAKSLKAQRAGIRDFATAYANTFGVQKRLEAKYDQSLTTADVRRLGYQTLDSARTSLLQYLPSTDAKAHAKMYLIAERIGELPLEKAKPSYEEYIDKYASYTAYTSFLKDFYQRRKAVSPGQQAVHFSLPTPDGNRKSMTDYRGKYVLIDFWATWCIPCLDAIDDLEQIYDRYPHDQFEIVSISIEEDSSTWRSALQQYDMPWVQLYGGHGVNQSTFSAYQAGGIPFYVLVDPEGTILRYNDIRPAFNMDSVLSRYVNPTH